MAKIDGRNKRLQKMIERIGTPSHFEKVKIDKLAGVLLDLQDRIDNCEMNDL